MEEFRRQAFARGAPFEIEQRTRRRDGEYRWFLVKYNPFGTRRASCCAGMRPARTSTTASSRKNGAQRDSRAARGHRPLVDVRGDRRAPRSSPCWRRSREVAVDRRDGAHSRRDGHRQGADRARHPQALAGAPVERSSASTAPRFRPRSWLPSSSATRKARLRARCSGGLDGSRPRTAARSSSTRSASCRPRRKSALLRVLQERELERVGSSRPIASTSAMLAATNRDLETAVERGTFRDDLFYRLNVFPIGSRRCASARRTSRCSSNTSSIATERRPVSGSAASRGRRWSRFQSYDWPGNVRELQNVIERAVVLCDGDTFVVEPSWLKVTGPRRAEAREPRSRTLAERERRP